MAEVAVVTLPKLVELLILLVTEGITGTTVSDRVVTVVEVGVTLGAAVTTDVTPELEAASCAALATISGAMLVVAVATGGVTPVPARVKLGLVAELTAAAPEPDAFPVSLFRSEMFFVSSATRVDASLA